MIHHDNFLNNQLPDKSVQLIIADPPYFEVKGEFDFVWPSFEAYLEDVDKWAKECKRVLADNGTLFWWGMDRKLAYSQIILDKYLELIGTPVWEKPSIASEWETRRSFPERAQERLLMYSNELDNETGLEKVMEEHIKPRHPFANYLRSEFKRAGVEVKEFRRFVVGVMKYDSAMVNRWLDGDCNPSKDQYHKIRDFLKGEYLTKEYEELRQEYEELRQEYEDLRRPFNNRLKLTDVLRFSQESQHSKKWKHPTRKPEKLTTALIECCSRVGDTVLVPFAGSGTECAMAVRSGRKYIGFEIDENHVNTARKRVSIEESTPKLFYS